MRASSIAVTFAFASALVLPGCPWCPTGELEVVSGAATDGVIAPGEVVELRATYGDDWEAGPGACGGHWYVNLVEGGSAELGTIDACGRYVAPSVFPDGLAELQLEAAEHGRGECADCCPSAVRSFQPGAASAP